jgi:hypothetical protein
VVGANRYVELENSPFQDHNVVTCMSDCRQALNW